MYPKQTAFYLIFNVAFLMYFIKEYTELPLFAMKKFQAFHDPKPTFCYKEFS